MMYGKGQFPGGGCLAALVVLAVIGLATLAYNGAQAWRWLAEHVHFE